jgi:acetylornithine deacetylase/succinyl-diaminopimelate desuccinylase-like protein
MKCSRWLILVVALASATAAAQSASREYSQHHSVEILREFADLLSLPNVATQTPEGRAYILRNAEFIQKAFARRGTPAQILTLEGGFPAVFAEVRSPGASQTIAFYAHFDGQPLNPTDWATPPFSPVVRKGALPADAIDLASLPAQLPAESAGWRIYGRSASDDKAPIVAFLAALDSLRAAGQTPKVNLKFFFEGEEEAGSPHLPAMAAKYADLLKADLWILCDGPVHQSGAYQLVFGARGVVGLEMRTFGPKRPLHSGHYGNWAPNPATEIANIVAGMRDAEGNILIRDFYNPVRKLTAEEETALGQMPNVDAQLRSELALGRSEGQGKSLSALLMRPALNVRGLQAGAVGAAAANAIMTDAHCSIDFRLVPDQTPAGVKQAVENHLRGLGYWIIYKPPSDEERTQHAKVIQLTWDEGYPAARTSLSLPAAQKVLAAMQAATGKPAIRVPMLGGSIPMYVFKDLLHAPVVLLPIANYDNNQHAANENIRLENFWMAIDIYAELFERLGGER